MKVGGKTTQNHFGHTLVVHGKTEAANVWYILNLEGDVNYPKPKKNKRKKKKNKTKRKIYFQNRIITERTENKCTHHWKIIYNGGFCSPFSSKIFLDFVIRLFLCFFYMHRDRFAFRTNTAERIYLFCSFFLFKLYSSFAAKFLLPARFYSRFFLRDRNDQSKSNQFKFS